MSEDKPKNITMKDTKSTILNAYTQLLANIEAKAKRNMGADAIRVSKRKQEVVDVADKALDTNQLSAILAAVENLGDDLERELETYENIKEAIEAKKAELQELFEIEKTAYTLAALVDSKNSIVEQYQQKMDENQIELEKRLEGIREEIDKEIKAEDERRRKEKAEYAYDLERKKLKDNDDLEDVLASKMKVVGQQMSEDMDRLTIREKEVSEREAGMTAREEEIENLKLEVAAAPERLAEEVKRKVGKEKAMLAGHHETEKKFMIAASDSAASIAAAKIEEMEKNTEILKTTIAEQQVKLDGAYKEIKEMAVKTVEGAGNNQMFQEMKNMLGDKNPK